MVRNVLMAATLLLIAAAAGAVWFVTAHGFSARQQPSALRVILGQARAE
ncbi:MAG: hypothetical protein ACE14L_18075 [Terriglobales bacterium]